MSPLCTVAAKVRIKACSGPGNRIVLQYCVKIPTEKVYPKASNSTQHRQFYTS